MNGWIAGLVLAVLSRAVIAQDIAAAANVFLTSLDAGQKSKAQYGLSDPERFNWYFVPKSRNGLIFRSMSEEQRGKVFDLLRLSLSSQGYQKATAIISNETLLRALEGRPESDTYRDPQNYYVTIFGTPSSDKPWFWRLEGHHLALNFAFNHHLASSTPTFWGSNPGTVPSGAEKGRQILKRETELAFELLGSLTPDQRKSAVFSETAPHEIITGNDRKAQRLTPAGLSYSSMTEAQQKLLMTLVETYTKNYEFDFSNRLMAKITAAGINNLAFAWAGSLTPGAGHYYRIQGPMLLIEYDNTQNNANHVHAVVRDLTNDFAEDILREHYLKEHGASN